MLTGAYRRRRRIWARLTAIASIGCFAASAWIWWSHATEYMLTGHVHHTSIAEIAGITTPGLQITLCLMLPLLGCFLFYLFLLIWGVGVYRGHGRVERRAAQGMA